SRTNQVTVTLQETAHPGLFRGTLTLVAAGAGTNQLQVLNGDTITATYFDASNGSNVIATASIDTVPPVISNVAATTDYYNAKVTWLTSKPADSAVQYNGLPQPPANSVYNSALVTNHSLTISGLLANRVYYYQVVSRDQAGNTTVDDNGGNYYAFQTLKGLTPPWSTDFEMNTDGWTVVPDPSTGSEINWELGTPNNGLVSSAYSGTNAWGSDLHGTPISFIASSYLYSPVIDLSGLSSATLTFYDVGDFSQDTEDGVVFISTNSSEPPSLSLPLGMDFVGNVADNWQQETVSLNAFVGQSVQIVFYYQAYFGAPKYHGWTIDDVSINGVVAGGNVNITKNLGQGTWSLSSLSSIGLVPIQSGTVPSITISNLPAADYVVQFGDVPYYQSPPGQTNTLAVGGTVSFNGNYGFIDVNSNNISDSWERDYFGSATVNRTQLTDTDGDGMTDYAEFIAGTNPTNAASNFRFLSAEMQTNREVNLRFSTVPGRLYQLESSTNLQAWETNAPWLQAGSGTMSLKATNNAPGVRFYRVQVRP
ncbi:MAG TPA: choice-of-anchor J domain-containing protein, partial [Candidatus Binatia bacterium]|nr:choice-of-anchor J domain-containing protein [Candidatus Binatia bacterium]